MRYPLHIQEIELPNGPFHLYVPIEEQVPLVYQQLQATGNDPPPFPYWARLWPSALALAGYIQRNPQQVAGKRVAELGAGLGLPSLVAAPYARSVWCSDMAEEAMMAVAKSSLLHQFTNLHTAVCNWKQVPENLAPEVVLLSDVNYHPHVFDNLIEALLQYLYSGATLLLTTPQRLMAKPFIEKLLPWCTEQQVVSIHDGDEETKISLLVLEA